MGRAARRTGHVRHPGFTLLEVMVAVLALGIVVTLLTRAAVDGMQLEGDAHRRLAASLLADRLVADLEAGLLGGVVPQVGQQNLDEGEFGIVLEARPLDPATLGLELGDRRDLGPPLGLVAGDGLGATPPVVEIEIAVTWKEGIHTQEVRRTTFGFDAQTAAADLPTASSQAGGDPDVDPDDPAGELE